MIKKQILTFLLRWMISCLAMYACINIFCTIDAEVDGFTSGAIFYLTAGLVFATVNTVVKPLATIFSLPFMLMTLGLFTIIINVAMLGLTILILPDVRISFWGAVGGSLLIAVINYLVSVIGIDKVPEKVVKKTKKGGVQSDATCKNKEK